MPGGQRGNEAMQFAIERDLLENVAAIGLERGAKIVNVDSAELGHQPVRAARGDAAQPEIVDALFAPAADDVVTLGDFFEKGGNIGGIMLQVAVHGDDEFAARMIEAGS